MCVSTTFKRDFGISTSAFTERARQLYICPLRIRQNSLTPQLLDLRRIENSRGLIDKWNGQLPTVESGQGSGMMLQLPKP